MENEIEYSKEIRNRLSRNLGHLAKVKEMVDKGDSFERVMLQLSAVRNSLSSTASALAAERIQQELTAALETDDPERIHKFYKAYSKYF